ncbi:fructosamine kinase family protein [Teredinibacter turnerae]|uniref:fructosamine kinase family protein n=1 Tax=Teredinibacter turnerae TaxID=2426 RepID=UPI0030CA8739
MTAKLWQDIKTSLCNRLEQDLTLVGYNAVGGGDINESFRLETDRGSFFVKHNSAGEPDMFHAEAAGLACLSSFNQLRCPQPLVCGEYGGTRYFVMTFLHLTGTRNDDLLGKQLASLHRESANSHAVTDACSSRPPAATPFGLQINNYIGLSPQSNAPAEHWHSFWLEHRMEPQLRQAIDNGYNVIARGLKRLEENTEILLHGHQPMASAVHGDLWSGNKGICEDGSPAIFDPAFYFGDREVDIALSRLFGGFSSGFYHQYNATWPLDAGFEQREHLYNLYHLLNHLNLFGHGYLRACLNTIEKIDQLAAAHR